MPLSAEESLGLRIRVAEERARLEEEAAEEIDAAIREFEEAARLRRAVEQLPGRPGLAACRLRIVEALHAAEDGLGFVELREQVRGRKATFSEALRSLVRARLVTREQAKRVRLYRLRR